LMIEGRIAAGNSSCLMTEGRIAAGNSSCLMTEGPIAAGNSSCLMTEGIQENLRRDIRSQDGFQSNGNQKNNVKCSGGLLDTLSLFRWRQKPDAYL
jgi:hypothetical protein